MSKVAIVSYWAPPGAAVASHRVLRLSRTLLRHGHEVHWVTVDIDAPQPDPSLQRHTPPEVVRHGLGKYCLLTKKAAKGFIQKVLRNLAHKLPHYFPTPDGLIEWGWRLKKNLARIVAENDIDTVFISCGPHGQITAVPKLRRQAPHLKIIVDYRDLLTGNLYHPGTAWTKRRLVVRERKILSMADQLFVNTEEARARFLELVQPPQGLPVTVMRNAADYELGDAIISEGKAPEFGDGIHLGYFGNIFERRRLRPVLAAVNELPEEVARRVRLHVFTNAWSQRLLDEDREAVGGIAKEICVKHNPVPYGDALCAMRAMDALVLVNGAEEEDRIYVPGKLYDYLMARRPVLFVGQEGDAWRIVSEVCGEEWCSRHDRPERLTAALAAMGEGRPAEPDRCQSYDPDTTFQPLLKLLKS